MPSIGYNLGALSREVRFMDKIKKNLYILIPLLILLVLIIFLSINQNNINNSDYFIKIKDAQKVNTTLQVMDNSKIEILVPEGIEGESSQIFKYDVLWTGTGASGARGTLKVNVQLEDINQKISNERLNYLFKVSLVNEEEIVAGTKKVYEIEVSFKNEPENKEEYLKLIESKIIIKLEFEVIAENIA
ncbi:hypothetical protein BN85413020 [Alteracholeplasma palmae J233]|uniref:Uncharacterized protein n=2 Tax=Acholeplasma palmae TaxID=38986 RepID=U4KLM9_ALTPJ|nr:hypothetical protein BN85413020 [Alteracholeplasma palmae J233]